VHAPGPAALIADRAPDVPRHRAAPERSHGFVGVPTRLDLGVLRALRAHAAAAYPDEACGLLVGARSGRGGGSVHRIVPTDNVARDRRRAYAIDPRIVRGWERRPPAAPESLLGAYHSHPDAPALPSAGDGTAAWPGYLYLIIEVRGGRAGRVGSFRWATLATTTTPADLPTRARSRSGATA
jgi:proteasome lid subunit RPN8/RPN11